MTHNKVTVGNKITAAYVHVYTELFCSSAPNECSVKQFIQLIVKIVPSNKSFVLFVNIVGEGC